MDFGSYAGFDWDLLRRSTEKVQEQGANSGLWVILGSSHPLSGVIKPHKAS